MKLKKFLAGAFLGMFAFAGVVALPTFAQPVDNGDSTTTTDWANPGKQDLIGNREQQGSALLDSAKKTVNWLLGILATIALVICLYAGFLMVTSAGDEKKYQKGVGILKYAAIGLAIVGLAWLFVSLISWFVGAMGGDKV